MFFVLAHSTADEVATAKDIMQSTRPAEVGLRAAKRAAVSATCSCVRSGGHCQSDFCLPVGFSRVKTPTDRKALPVAPSCGGDALSFSEENLCWCRRGIFRTGFALRPGRD